jgi:hypothetical protein
MTIEAPLIGQILTITKHGLQGQEVRSDANFKLTTNSFYANQSDYIL